MIKNFKFSLLFVAALLINNNINCSNKISPVNTKTVVDLRKLSFVQNLLSLCTTSLFLKQSMYSFINAYIEFYNPENTKNIGNKKFCKYFVNIGDAFFKDYIGMDKFNLRRHLADNFIKCLFLKVSGLNIQHALIASQIYYMWSAFKKNPLGNTVIDIAKENLDKNIPANISENIKSFYGFFKSINLEFNKLKNEIFNIKEEENIKKEEENIKNDEQLQEETTLTESNNQIINKLFK